MLIRVERCCGTHWYSLRFLRSVGEVNNQQPSQLLYIKAGKNTATFINGVWILNVERDSDSITPSRGSAAYMQQVTQLQYGSCWIWNNKNIYSITWCLKFGTVSQLAYSILISRICIRNTRKIINLLSIKTIIRAFPEVLQPYSKPTHSSHSDSHVYNWLLWSIKPTREGLLTISIKVNLFEFLCVISIKFAIN